MSTIMNELARWVPEEPIKRVHAAATFPVEVPLSKIKKIKN